MSAAVVDSSVVVAALLDNGPVGDWAASIITSHRLLGPALLPSEVVNVLRRVRGPTSWHDVIELAHVDFLDLSVALHPYSPFAWRAWALKDNVTMYDAWYVALAEAVEAPLATLDRRLASAPGPTCEFLLPPP